QLLASESCANQAKYLTQDTPPSSIEARTTPPVCVSASLDSDSRQTVPGKHQPVPWRPRFRALLVLATGLALLALLRGRESNLESFGSALEHVRWSWAVAAIAFNLL